MIRAIAATGATSSALTLLAVWALGWTPASAKQTVQQKVKLENSRVKVTEVTSPAGAIRERHIRERDQVIVFLDDCRYERVDPKTGEKTVRERKSGDVIWHDRAEAAPLLTNAGTHTFRQIVIEVK